MDEISFAEQFVPQGPLTVNDIFRRALAPDREEIEAARREREEAAAREEHAERVAMANRQMGDPLGNLTRSQMAAAEARERVQALEDQLAEARKVLHRCAEQYVGWQEQAEVVQAAASRSATHDLLSEAKRVAAEHRVDQMLAQRSAQGPARRPKGHGGLARRSDQPVTCQHCRDVGASPEESWLLHNDPDSQIETELVDLSEQALAAFGRETGAPYRPSENTQRDDRSDYVEIRR